MFVLFKKNTLNDKKLLSLRKKTKIYFLKIKTEKEIWETKIKIILNYKISKKKST